MARASREFAVTHRPQDPAQGLLGDRHAVIVTRDLRQIAQAPAHHPVSCGRRLLFDQGPESLALLSIQAAAGTGGLAVDQPVQAVGVEGHDESHAPSATRPRQSRSPPSASPPAAITDSASGRRVWSGSRGPFAKVRKACASKSDCSGTEAAITSSSGFKPEDWITPCPTPRLDVSSAQRDLVLHHIFR